METIKKIIVTNDFSTGQIAIDRDHKKLIEIYNELTELIDCDINRNDFARILSEMTDYSLVHFKREEDYMESFTYPQLAEHIAFHREYIYKVAKFNASLLSFSPPEPIEIVKFLEKWWVHHILKIDALYEKYKRELPMNIKN